MYKQFGGGGVNFLINKSNEIVFLELSKKKKSKVIYKMQVFQYTDVKMSENKKREENPPNCPIILQIKMRIEILILLNIR